MNADDAGGEEVQCVGEHSLQPVLIDLSILRDQAVPFQRICEPGGPYVQHPRTYAGP